MTSVGQTKITPAFMAAEGSFSTVPEAPTTTEFSTVPDDPTSPELNRTCSNNPTISGGQDEALILAELHIPDEVLENFPKLFLEPYHTKRDCRGTNVLSLVHNAAKREVADLVSVVIPSLRHIETQNEFHDGEKAEKLFDGLSSWWGTLLRFFFFVAECDDDVIKVMLQPATRSLKRQGELKYVNELEKKRKSLADRYSFTMELIFRGADRALDEFEEEPSQKSMSRLLAKFEGVAKFMLGTMAQATGIATEIESICDIEVTSLEHSIVDSLTRIAREDKPLFMYTCARWMNDESRIKQWIFRYGGLRGRFFFDSWKQAHDERRASFIGTMGDISLID